MSRLAIGPVLYYWPADQLRAFYAMVADSPAEIVYLGETVCSKRRSLNVEEWLEIADGLAGRTDQSLALARTSEGQLLAQTLELPPERLLLREVA